MKNILSLIIMAVAFCASAEEPKKFVSAKAPPETAKWIDSITVAPVGAIKTEHLDGPSQWGAGLDIGYNVNPFVGLHVVNLSFEGAGKTSVTSRDKNGKHTVTSKSGEDSWGGLLVDETDVQVDAKIAKFSNETFSLHFVGGAQTDWNDNNYGVNAGMKVVLDVSKHLGFSAGYTLRTWLKGATKVDSLATAQLTLTL